jgi:hypothetical protein
MEDSTIWLRVSYWTGALVDLKAAIIMVLPNLFPPLYEAIGGKTAGGSASGENSMTLLAALLVFAWTCLLIWADRKPLERKGVLLLTLCPVLVGILAIRVQRMVAAVFSTGYLVFTLLLIVIMGLFLFSYLINTLSGKKLRNMAG